MILWFVVLINVRLVRLVGGVWFDFIFFWNMIGVFFVVFFELEFGILFLEGLLLFCFVDDLFCGLSWLVGLIVLEECDGEILFLWEVFWLLGFLFDLYFIIGKVIKYNKSLRKVKGLSCRWRFWCKVVICVRIWCNLLLWVIEIVLNMFCFLMDYVMVYECMDCFWRVYEWVE